MKEAEEQKQADNVIGDSALIKITNFPSSRPLKGKVDTGATVSSLHADRWKLNRDTGKVEFVSKELSPNVITMDLADQHAIKTPDGGVEYRPVISLNIKVGEKLLTDVMFNLNDRGHMDFPILIGQNVLEKGKFLIDPRMNESEDEDIDWDTLREAIEIEFDSEIDPKEPVGDPEEDKEEVMDHHHTIDQIKGLQEELDELRAMIAPEEEKE